ncbi:MAG: chorismate mutase [Pseudomonadota bacterium]
MPPTDNSLESLRHEIDAIDEAMHDLLMRRVGLFDRLQGAKDKDDVAVFHAGREAQIVRRLVARHKGKLPPQAVVRVWREIIAALIRLQGPFAIAVYAPAGVTRYVDLAHEHFSNLTPLLPMGAPGSVVSAVTEGRTQLGIVPMPEDEPDEAWWRRFGGGGQTLHILARLPFAPSRPDPGPAALVVGRQPFDPTGADRGYLLIETDREVSRARMRAAFDAAGLPAVRFTAAAAEKGSRAATTYLLLMETESWCAADDPRLQNVVAGLGEDAVRLRPIGGYAVPLAVADLSSPKRTSNR